MPLVPGMAVVLCGRYQRCFLRAVRGALCRGCYLQRCWLVAAD